MLYFSYAVLMSRGQMKRVCPEAETRGRARLRGYRIIFPRVSGQWMGGIPSLAEAKEGEVWGVLWEGSEECLAAVDQYQGFFGPDGVNVYVRLPVAVEDENGETQMAYAYQATGPNRGDFQPSEHFVDTVVRAAREFGVPEEYVAWWERMAPE